MPEIDLIFVIGGAMGRRFYSKVIWHGIVCLPLLLSSAPAFAQSAGCNATNAGGLSITNVGAGIAGSINLNLNGTFNAGEILTFSATGAIITAYTVNETTTATNIITAAGAATNTYTIPVAGAYNFDSVITVDNTGNPPATVSSNQSCAVPIGGGGGGVAPPPVAPPAAGGGVGSAIGGGVVAGGGAVGVVINLAQQRSNLNTAATNYIWGIVGSGYSGASRTSVLLSDFGSNRPTIREQQIEERRQELEQRRKRLVYLEGQRADYENAVKDSELAREKLLNIIVTLGNFALTDSEKLEIERIRLEESQGNGWGAIIRLKIFIDQSHRDNLYTFEDQLKRDQAGEFILYLSANLSFEQALYKISHDDTGQEIELFLTPQELRYYFGLSLGANALGDNLHSLSDIEAEIKQLEFEDIDPALDENPVHDVRDEVRGVVALSYNGFDGERASMGVVAPNVFQILRQGDIGGSFFADIGQLANSSPNGSVPTDTNNIDIWLKGSFSVLDDGSNAGRSGNSGNVSLGIAKRLSSRFALAGEVISRFGEFDIDQILSSTDFSGVGVAITGSFALADRVILSTTGFYEYGWFDTSLAGANASFNGDRLGISVDLSGIFALGDYVAQPGISLLYAESQIDAYTDSTALFVPSRTTQYGNVNASLTISRPLEGRGRIINWQPYVSGRISHDFKRVDNIAVSPTLIVNDGSTNGEIGGGTVFQFESGASTTFGATYFGLFGSGINFTKFGFDLNIPLN